VTHIAARSGPVGACASVAPSVLAPDPGARGKVAMAVAAAVDALSGVRRSRGTGVEIATQYRGGRTVGVRLRDDRVEIHVVAERPQIARLGEEIHAAARRALDGIADHRPVAVFVDDLDVVSLSVRGS
jgi:hypothetical protein